MKTLLRLLAFLVLPLVGTVEAAPEQAKPIPVVNVGGQVTKPGPVEYRKDTPLIAMIFVAGGPTKFGSMRRVKVYRDGKTLEFDLTTKKGMAELSKPNDTIEVPKKNIFGR